MPKHRAIAAMAPRDARCAAIRYAAIRWLIFSASAFGLRQRSHAADAERALPAPVDMPIHALMLSAMMRQPCRLFQYSLYAARRR